jgi:NurA-like 5'-3' nuclease
MDLESGCIDREVIKYGKLQDKLLEWRNKCFQSKSFRTPPETNTIDFNTLWNELNYENSCLSDDIN